MSKSDLSVDLGRLHLKNPVLTASGTFGYGEEYVDLIDLKSIGAIVTKTITLKPCAGNLPPRTIETPCGLLNSIGLENVGVEAFINEKLPFLKQLNTQIIVSIAGENADEYVAVLRRLSREEGIAAVEVNVSCPNVDTPDERLFAQDADTTRNIIKRLRKITDSFLIAKLTPNVEDIAPIARAAEAAGADAVSLVNTLAGMSVDIDKRRPVFARVIGGLSGPCIRPVAVRMVWEAHNAVSIPIIGMGGIISARDALEFIIAGASAVAVGTANFVDPEIAIEIIEGIRDYLIKNKISRIERLIGSLKV